jgi:hypothetical protein
MLVSEDAVRALCGEARLLSALQRVWADRLDARLAAIEQEFPWHRDLRAVFPRNPNCPGILAGGWWQRRVEDIKTVCFHHTLTHSPEWFASWYIYRDGGRPSVPYTFWISDTGEILLCNSLDEGCWHNHNGHKNLDLSVGLAGRRHEVPPSPAQLHAAATVAVWAIHSPMMPLVDSAEKVMGHMDYPYCLPGQLYETECPGWLSDGSGRWKPDLFERIEALLLVI